MAIRQSIGSRQLWAKIDSLPAPRSVKDMIQLKTYSPDKNGRLYVNLLVPLSVFGLPVPFNSSRPDKNKLHVGTSTLRAWIL